jgi:hypothetical protein
MKRGKIATLLIVLIIILLGAALFKKFYIVPKPGENRLTPKETKSLVTKVSKLINVPDEEPVIATIAKADELIAEQKFYAGSKDGDYLIVFPTNQKAIIYRKKENRLINVGPIIVDQTAASAPVPTATSTATSTKDKKAN